MLDIAPCQCASVSVESIDLTCHIQDVMIWNAQGPAFQLKPCLLPWCQVSILPAKHFTQMYASFLHSIVSQRLPFCLSNLSLQFCNKASYMKGWFHHEASILRSLPSTIPNASSIWQMHFFDCFQVKSSTLTFLKVSRCVLRY